MITINLHFQLSVVYTVLAYACRLFFRYLLLFLVHHDLTILRKLLTGEGALAHVILIPLPKHIMIY